MGLSRVADSPATILELVRMENAFGGNWIKTMNTGGYCDDRVKVTCRAADVANEGRRHHFRTRRLLKLHLGGWKVPTGHSAVRPTAKPVPRRSLARHITIYINHKAPVHPPPARAEVAYVSVPEPLSRLASCRIEFGTGFLPPETGTPKGA